MDRYSKKTCLVSIYIYVKIKFVFIPYPTGIVVQYKNTMENKDDSCGPLRSITIGVGFVTTWRKVEEPDKGYKKKQGAQPPGPHPGDGPGGLSGKPGHRAAGGHRGASRRPDELGHSDRVGDAQLQRRTQPTAGQGQFQ